MSSACTTSAPAHRECRDNATRSSRFASFDSRPLVETKQVGSHRRSSRRQAYFATLALAKIAGARTALAVPMLKEDELLAPSPFTAKRFGRSPTSRSSWSRTSPRRRSSPSRTRGCSASCANRCSSRPPPPTCSRSSAVRQASLNPYFRRCWRTRRASVEAKFGMLYLYDGDALPRHSIQRTADIHRVSQTAPLRPGPDTSSAAPRGQASRSNRRYYKSGTAYLSANPLAVAGADLGGIGPSLACQCSRRTS